ncbi:MAG TPA: thiolase family protein [Deltaproteobacteria bacterium]|nr:thiolase family protein [Deltaproteobacteria bacterium]OQC27855.1 MAG: acetyl-CoA acetyltransferase [Deltaproteobacteria bacterium ADurb.Bin072]HNQ86757.1 thiolase family protein [Deltaproteobacteria bacterium]HOA44893.1 thiolase family protein [Deltaproteobacteria bacterium]HOC76525.1 thiolase family protein [Deltaproteobacteria bacterium]
MSDDVYIVGVGMIKFGKYLDTGIKALTGEALDLALRDCGLSLADIEAAWFSNSSWGISSFQHCIRGQVALSANGLAGIPITNVENACAGGSTALNAAWMAIKAGQFDCVLAIGAEKLYGRDRAKTMEGFISGTDVEVTMQLIAQFQEGEKKRREEQAKHTGEKVVEEKPGGHSSFMDLYAMGARMHMERYGSTQRQLAVIAAKAHNNSTFNSLAQYTFPMTVDEVMADREVAWPLTRAMCAPIGDGAAATIVCGKKFMKRIGKNRAVRIRASVLKSGTREGDNDICARSSSAAYAMAGVGPEDIDVAEVHDATAFGELYQTEQMGFCPVGEGGRFAESGETAIGGKIPINPSGGLMARGHPIGASGLAQVFELVTHLRGEAGTRQVNGARIAMAENGGGFLGMGEAAMAIHILEKIT